MINWKVRFKNPIFLVQIILAIILPILAYMGLTVEDLTTWGAVFNCVLLAAKNPYVLSLVVISVWNALNDPTTVGIKDSARALHYDEPYKAE